MRSVYIIVDFSYNPSAQEPLKLFELGDAFASGHMPLGKDKSTYSLFIDDLAQRYPDALMVNVFPVGLTLTDLNSKSEYLSYDNSRLFKDDPLDTDSPSCSQMIRLIDSIIQNKDKRSVNSKPLIIYLRHPDFLGYKTNKNFQKNSNLELLNVTSEEFHSSLFNKLALHRNAHKNPLYPSTLPIKCTGSLLVKTLSDVNDFMQKVGAEYYVLKPTNGTRSEFVHVVSAQNLTDTIERILQANYDEAALKRYQASGLLIQACHPSRLISHKGQQFHAKGRTFIRADFTENTELPKLNFITGYWQLANQPFHQEELNDKNLIAYGAANPEGAFEIESKEWDTIKGLFNEHLPSLLAAMDRSEKEFILYYKREFQASQQEFTEALTDFFLQQQLMPAGPIWFQKMYYEWNKYIGKGLNRALIKQFIIDFTGLDQRNKKIIPLDDRSSSVFIKDSVEVLYNPVQSLAVHKNKYNETLYFCKTTLILFFFCASIAAVCELIAKNRISSNTIIMGIISTTTMQLYLTFNSYLEKTSIAQTFFTKSLPVASLEKTQLSVTPSQSDRQDHALIEECSFKLK